MVLSVHGSNVSDFAAGAVLFQYSENNKLNPLHYDSYEKELLAIVVIIAAFKEILSDRKIQWIEFFSMINYDIGFSQLLLKSNWFYLIDTMIDMDRISIKNLI
ncbi:hypothetical protein H8356DRAFT_1358931 [Neocallimastix lanati (nom. inval.)]|nr:hypothetical protein H8356DRAFT_1358931 [Neocallimastix sp. JGI-2020a]